MCVVELMFLPSYVQVEQGIVRQQRKLLFVTVVNKAINIGIESRMECTIEPILHATRADERELYEDECAANGEQCLRRSHNGLLDDTEFDKLQMDKFLAVDSHGMFLESRGISQTLNEDQLILLPYRVHGFSLRSRKWGTSIVTINEESMMLTYGCSPIEYRSSARRQ